MDILWRNRMWDLKEPRTKGTPAVSGVSSTADRLLREYPSCATLWIIALVSCESLTAKPRLFRVFFILVAVPILIPRIAFGEIGDVRQHVAHVIHAA